MKSVGWWMQAAAHGVSCAARCMVSTIYREDFAISTISNLDINLLSVYDICDFDRGV